MRKDAEVRVFDAYGDGDPHVCIVIGARSTYEQIRDLIAEARLRRDELLENEAGARWLQRLSDRQRVGESYADLAATLNAEVRLSLSRAVTEPDPDGRWHLDRARRSVSIWLSRPRFEAWDVDDPEPVTAEDVRGVLRQFRDSGRIPSALKDPGVGTTRPVLPILRVTRSRQDQRGSA